MRLLDGCHIRDHITIEVVLVNTGMKVIADPLYAVRSGVQLT